MNEYHEATGQFHSHQQKRKSDERTEQERRSEVSGGCHVTITNSVLVLV